MRADYCPIGGEPCQSLCAEPCSVLKSVNTAVVRQPLTDEQIDALQLPESGKGTIRDLVRIIEAAHGIGGGMTDVQKPVLQQLLTLLGPEAPACCGCAEEWQAAIDLIKGELE